MARLKSLFCVCMNNFLQGGEQMEFRKLLSVDAMQTAPWGGELSQLVEDLQEYLQQGYCVMLFAGS